MGLIRLHLVLCSDVADCDCSLGVAAQFVAIVTDDAAKVDAGVGVDIVGDGVVLLFTVLIVLYLNRVIR